VHFFSVSGIFCYFLGLFEMDREITKVFGQDFFSKRSPLSRFLPEFFFSLPSQNTNFLSMYVLLKWHFLKRNDQ